MVYPSGILEQKGIVSKPSVGLMPFWHCNKDEMKQYVWNGL